VSTEWVSWKPQQKKDEEELIMIGELSKDDLIELGSRNRATHLLEQYGYTMGVAKLDGEELAALLPAWYPGEVHECADNLRASMQNKLFTAEEAKGSTQLQNDLMRQAKIWRRAAVSRAERAAVLGKKIPAPLTRMEKGQNVQGVAAQIEGMVKLLEANAKSLHGPRLNTMIAEGLSLAKDLRDADALQDVKRIKTASEAVRTFYFLKGQLFTAIKAINLAGRELHAGDAEAATRYGLKILYRNAKKRKKSGEDKKQ
jgi:hypothetical protein